jgi:hypothetical protein
MINRDMIVVEINDDNTVTVTDLWSTKEDTPTKDAQ